MVVDRSPSSGILRSTIPARLDRLPWSPFHTRLVLALGTCWVLDGFEIVVAANVGAQLGEPENLGLGPTAVGFLATVYLLGEVIGALVFGRLADRFGRRRLFLATLATYFAGSALTAAVFGHGVVPLVALYVTRFVAGAGMGGEYAAINSTIDELVPAQYRGRVDITVNGTYWAGAGLAAAIQVPLLSGMLDPRWDWRIALLIGPVLACGIWLLRRNLPESPRWLIVHGRSLEADTAIERIEREVDPTGRTLTPVGDDQALPIRPVPAVGYLRMLRMLYEAYPRSCVLGATMMITQSFLYNAVVFSYASVLTHFFGVDGNDTAMYLIPFAAGNLLGPLLLGRLFDKIGRRTMIYRTYGLAGVLLVVSSLVFGAGGFTAASQTVAWCVVFFFGSAGASAAYLTVSEIFPMEVRARAIAIFFAIAQTAGSVAPLFYGLLIDRAHPDRASLLVGFLIGAVLMLAGAITAKAIAVDAENRGLEAIAPPLAVQAARDPDHT